MDCIQQLHGSSLPRPCQGQDSERTTCGGALGCLPRNKKRNEGSLSLPFTRNFLQVPFSSKGLRRFPKGERKALWSPPQRRNPLGYGESKEASFLAIHKKSISCERFRPPAGGRGTFPARESTQRAPGAAKGCMRHGRPRSPVAKKQCTASLAGARPAGLTAYLGGPLSPSAQSIPPPVRWRRLILGVMARSRCHKDTLLWVSCGEKRVTVVAPTVARPGEVPLLAQGGRGTSLGDEGRRREHGGKRGIHLPPGWRGYASKGESLCRNKGPFSLFAFQANGTML